MNTDLLIWAAACFLCGSLPFSYWIGRLMLRKDIREFGDGNPGATNVFRAGGKLAGALAAGLDGLKGLVPVAFAYYSAGFRGPELTVIALAPVFGHAFSPFLGFRGGKAVAVTFGVWTALTIYEVPTVFGLLLFYWFRSVKISGWAVMLAGLSTMGYLLLARPDPALLAILTGNLILFAYKHRADLAQPPGLRAQPKARRWILPHS